VTTALRDRTIAGSTLELRGVARSYGNVPAVRDVSFSLQPGEICGYLGANGCGKTTTLRMVAGLLPPTSGNIFYDGQSIHADLPGYREVMGYVPEEPYLYSHLSGTEYLELVGGLRRLPATAVRRRIEVALGTLGLSGSRDAPISTYSKGMKQKILLAAALLHDPEVLILDEPLSGLDVNAVQLVHHLFRQLAERGRIVLYSSHILEVVERLCNRVIVLHQGRVVADAPVTRLRELLQAPSLDAAFAQLTARRDPEADARALVKALAE